MRKFIGIAVAIGVAVYLINLVSTWRELKTDGFGAVAGGLIVYGDYCRPLSQENKKVIEMVEAAGNPKLDAEIATWKRLMMTEGKTKTCPALEQALRKVL